MFVSFGGVVVFVYSGTHYANRLFEAAGIPDVLVPYLFFRSEQL
jgi:hypothetical protein